MEILLHNIQSIRDAKLEFPETGIVEFVGDNSNGKSILEKTLSAIVSGDIEDEEERRTLVSDGETSGYVIMLRGQKCLSINIDHVRDKTIFQYTPDINNKEAMITRTLREGGVKDLVEEFGWKVYDDGAICLQLYPTFGHIPFINTSTKVNAEITDDVLRDKIAEKFMGNYEGTTYKLAQQKIKEMKQRKQLLEENIAGMHLYDYQAYEELRERIQRCKDFFECYVELTLEPLPIIPKVRVISIPQVELNEIPIVKPAPTGMRLEDASDILSQISDVLKGRCPTCGRLMVEPHTHTV